MILKILCDTSFILRKVKFGKGPNFNDSNVYWNFGGINFGSGFTSTGSSVKQY